MNASGIMTSCPITVTPQTPVAQIAKLLLDNRISGVPVVEDDGRLVGIVSEGDLMRRSETGTEPRHSWWLALIASPDDTASDYLKSHGLRAADVMTRDVVTVGPEASPGDIAELLERRRIKRVPVVENGKVVGIVSRADLVRSLAVHKLKIISLRDNASDNTIRDNLLKHLEEGKLLGPWINPIVSDGVVHLWGFVESDTQRDAICLAAKSIRGVKSVVSHLGIVSGTTRAVLWAE